MEPEKHVQPLRGITEESFHNIRAASTALLLLSENENCCCVKGMPMMILKLSYYLEDAAREIEKAIADRDDLDGLGPLGFEYTSVFDYD
jgi:hypothetical protein